jgi:hypothetical protein
LREFPKFSLPRLPNRPKIIGAFRLEELVRRQLLDRHDVAPWIAAIKEFGGGTPKQKWLIPGQKADQFSETLKLLKKTTPKPKVIRIVSPYYDTGSLQLAKEIISEFGLDASALEFWIDRTGTHTTGSHLQSLIALCDKLKITSVRYPVRVIRTPAIIRDERPLHAKLIEVLGSDGSGTRVIGSPNFTRAAWKGSNLESISIESFPVGSDFASVLPEDFDNQDNLVAIADLKKDLAKAADIEESVTGSDDPVGYWAVFDECTGDLRAHFRADVALDSFQVESHYNPMRDADVSPDGQKDVAKLKVAADLFSNPKNWHQLPSASGFLHAHLEEVGLRTPEWIRLLLRFAHGKFLRIPIILSRPNFQSRDPETGIPKELSSIADLFGHAPPFVRPAGPTQIEPDDVGSDGDDEMENPEDLEQTQIDLGSLSESPEFNHLPESIKVIKRIQRAGYLMDPKKLISDLVGIAKRTRSARQRLLAKALIEVLRGGT